jgi:hypothetical protein
MGVPHSNGLRYRVFGKVTQSYYSGLLLALKLFRLIVAPRLLEKDFQRLQPGFNIPFRKGCSHPDALWQNLGW